MPENNKYPLEPLIKARQAEQDALRSQVSALRDTVSAIENVVRGLKAEIDDAQARLKYEASDGVAMLVDRRRLLALYVKDRGIQLAEQHKRLAQEREQLAEAMGALTEVRRALRALERHKERFQLELNLRVAKSLEKTLDEMWLNRRGVLSYE